MLSQAGTEDCCPFFKGTQLVYKWLNSMVYGKYNITIVNGDYFRVYKPTFTSLWGKIL
jgi:hypothetical protein